MISDAAQLILGEPKVAGPLAVFPVFGPAPVFDYRPFSTAVEHGAFVKELERGASVNQLLVGNPTDRALLLYEGEQVLGAQQDRTIDSNVLVGAGAQVEVPVSCVEAGRWDGHRHGEHFCPAPHADDPSLRRVKRESALRRAGQGLAGRPAQGEVWQEVGSRLQRFGVASQSSKFSDLFVQRRGEIGALADDIEPAADQVGALACVGGAPVALDVVSRPEVFAALHDRLVRGYALDALSVRRVRGEVADPTVAGAFFARALRRRAGRCRPRGLATRMRWSVRRSSAAASRSRTSRSRSARSPAQSTATTSSAASHARRADACGERHPGPPLDLGRALNGRRGDGKMAVVTRRRSLALTLLAVLLTLAGLAAGYVRWQLADPERFGDRAVDALRSKEVRVAVAEQVAVAMVERGSPDLVASRPLLLASVEAILETDEFGRVMRRSAIAANRALLRGDTDVLVELQQARDLLVPAVESVSPRLAREIPTELRPRVAEIRGSDAATLTVRVAHSASAAALPLLIAAAVVLGLAVALAPDRTRAVATAGLVFAAGGAGGLVVMAGLRAQVVGHAGETGVLSDDDARAAASAAWDALAGGLQQWFLVMGVAGLALAAGALLVDARVDRMQALRHAAELVAGGDLPRAVRLLRGAGLAAVGALILLGIEPLLGAAVAVLGGVLVVLGLTEALSTLPRRQDPARSTAARLGKRPIAVGSAVVAAVAVTAAVLLIDGGPPAAPKRSEITACNGSAVLCGRRLDEVVLPGTHNSMAVADRPGWYFANQIRPIPRQLSEGIRLLMIDAHYGVVDGRGRVRTDLIREGTSRNRAARQLGPEAVRVAERLAGRLGFVPARGEAEIFLCHTLCELGAERMSSTLDELRGFLESHTTEVVVLFVESSVDPKDVEREFREAGLERYLATLSRDGPLPVLRAMIESGRRLVVLDQGDGGDAPWYQPAYLYMQDTRIDSLLESPTACDPGRGTPESPLLLMNHWIDRFPPSVVDSRDIGTRRALLRRVRACREQLGRAPNLIAVDFYEQGKVIEVARELNRSGR